MINWNILGIDPTKDKSQIKKAYRSKLAVTNPEDMPVEFMELRQAYEEALAWAQNEDADENMSDEGGSSYKIPDGPVGEWMSSIIDIYNDFGRRIDASEWQKPLSDPICTSLDMGAETEHALLLYMMDHCNLPIDVIRAIDQVFHFEKNKDRLFAEYPREFVNGILLIPLSEDVYGFPYELFQVDPDISAATYDRYLETFFRFSALTNGGQFDEAWAALNELLSIDIYHPSTFMEISKFHLMQGDIELAEEALEKIAPEHQELITVLCMKGEMSIEKKDYQAAEKFFKQVLEAKPDFNWAVGGLAETYFNMGEYALSYEQLREALKNNRYDGRANDLEVRLIPKLLEFLQGKVADGTAEDDEFLRLCGLLIDQNLPADSIKLLKSRTFDNARREALRNFYIGEASLDVENYQDTVEYIRKSRKLLRETLPFTTDEDEREKKISILCHGFLMESLACEYMGKLEDGLEVLSDGALDFPQDSMLVCRKAEVLYELKRYEAAVDCATQSIELDDSFHVAYRIRGNAYYELGMYSEAFSDCQQAIDIFEADLQAHFCQINILIEVGEFKDALEHIDSVEEQIQGTELLFLRGKAYEAQRKFASAIREYKNAIKMLGDKDREIVPPAEVKSPGALYFRLSYALSSVGREEEANDILLLGMEKYPDDSDLLSAMADIYTEKAVADRMNMVKAQECYDKILEKEGSSSAYIAVSAENLMALNRFDEAEKLLDIMEQEGHNPAITEILKGTLAMHLDRLDEAVAHYEKALTLQDSEEPDTPYIYRDLSMIHMRMKDYEKAEYYIMRNCQIFGEIRDYGYRLEMLRIQGRYEDVYNIGEDLISQILEMEEHTDEMIGELLEEMVGAAIDDGNKEKLEQYLEMIPDGGKKEFIRGRFCMFNSGLEEAYRHLETIFDGDDFEESLNSGEEDLIVISNRALTCAKVLMGMGMKIPARMYANLIIKKLQPKNYEVSGRDCIISMTHVAEAYAILGKFEAAELLMEKALKMRRCDFCKFSGCLDAWISLAYIYALKGDREKMDWAVAEGRKISPDDYDLNHQEVFFKGKTEKKGIFGGLFKK